MKIVRKTPSGRVSDIRSVSISAMMLFFRFNLAGLGSRNGASRGMTDVENNHSGRVRQLCLLINDGEQDAVNGLTARTPVQHLTHLIVKAFRHQRSGAASLQIPR